ncbi:MAG TPA: hypothetical protein VNI84_08670 [Pyrinomonadaceae bacterium]|nr:hypothetical protein [Pyrinomonadaceae bacterium]
MIDVSVKIESLFLNSLSAKLPGVIRQSFEAIAPDGKKIIQSEIPEAEGKLKAEGVSFKLTGEGIEYTVSRLAPGGFDYAVGVAEGTGIYGKKGKRIFPKKGKFLKIPIANLKGLSPERLASAKDGFIFVRSIKGQKANPFDKRSIKRFEKELIPKLAAAIDARL